MRRLWFRRAFLLAAAVALSALSQASAQQKLVVVIIGPPGSGKSVQAAKISAEYKIPTITMADLLKKEGGGKTSMNKKLKASIAGGDMVSDEMADDLIRRRIIRKDTVAGFVLDGYPANSKQADYLDALLKEHELPNAIIVYLDVPEQVAFSRMSARGRADDTPENMQRRWSEFAAEREAILKHYPGNRVLKVDGTHSADKVAQAIHAAINSRAH
jgi:adenylate kinase